MSAEYQKLHKEYAALAEKAAGGDRVAFKDKARVMGQIRQCERESARSGQVLSAVRVGDNIKVSAKDVRSKRSLQEEYISKFDDKHVVKLDGRETTLQQHHKRRLLGK